MDRNDPQDGGPAFPTLMKAGDVALAEGGLSVRDYFAIHADTTGFDFVAPVIAARVFGLEAPENTADTAAMVQFSAKVQAALRYQLADAMLAHRAKGRA